MSYANEDEDEADDLDRDSDEHEPDEGKSILVRVVCLVCNSVNVCLSWK